MFTIAMETFEDHHIIPQISSDIAEDNFQFYDIFEYPEMIIGAVDFEQTKRMSTCIYDKNSSIEVKESLYFSGGIQIRFISNSSVLIVKYHIINKKTGNFPHVGICNREGISCLFRSSDSMEWLPYDMSHSRGDAGAMVLHMNSRLDSKQGYEVVVNLPILAHVNGLCIGVEQGKDFIASPKMQNCKAIAFLGSLFTFGIGLTSSAFILSNVISRKYDVRSYNLGINSYDPYSNDVYDALKRIEDLSVIVIEGDNNRQNNNLFYSQFYSYLQKICMQFKQSTIVLMSQPHTRNNANDFVQRHEFLVGCLERLHKDGCTNIVFVDGKNIFSEVEKEYCAYSSYLLNDYASYVIFNKLKPFIKSLLSKEGI